jgi:hypothetical protein
MMRCCEKQRAASIGSCVAQPCRRCVLELFCDDALRSFLDQEVNVIDAQRSQLLVRALEVKQQSAKGNVDLAVRRITRQQSCLSIIDLPQRIENSGCSKKLTYSPPPPPQTYTPYPNKHNQTYPPENSPQRLFPSIPWKHPLWCHPS